MIPSKTFALITLILFSGLFMSACTQKPATFSDDKLISDITPYVDQNANEKINIEKDINLNQEFNVQYKTYNPDGIGTADFKAKSLKEIDKAGDNPADEGKKLILVEISVRGKSTNKGLPSTFNQIGEHPSPQFVIIDKPKNLSEVETTYFSDSYTQDNNLFELSKITLDQQQWLDTAIVFQIDKSANPDLAFRFTDSSGKITFYDLK
jgi:hypothetical protein